MWLNVGWLLEGRPGVDGRLRLLGGGSGGGGALPLRLRLALRVGDGAEDVRVEAVDVRGDRFEFEGQDVLLGLLEVVADDDEEARRAELVDDGGADGPVDGGPRDLDDVVVETIVEDLAWVGKW